MKNNTTRYVLVSEPIVQRCLDDIRARALNGTTVWSCEIKPYKKKRSLAQNNLYWMWVGIIADDLGYMEPEDIHEELAKIFLPPHFYTGLDKEQHERRMSTTALHVREFTDYLNRVEMWAATEFNIRLPHPMDYDEAMGR